MGAMQTFKETEDPLMVIGIDTESVVCCRKRPFGRGVPGAKMNTGRLFRIAILDCIAQQVLKHLPQLRGFHRQGWLGVVRNDRPRSL